MCVFFPLSFPFKVKTKKKKEKCTEKKGIKVKNK